MTKKHLFIVVVLLHCWLGRAIAQTPTKFPCNSILYFTRQYTPSPNSYLSAATFANGTVNIANPGTVALNLNASFFYDGLIWAQDWAPNAFTMVKIGSNKSGGNNVSASYTVSGMPNNTDLNNAAVTVDGTVYMLNGFTLYTFSVATGTPSAATTKTLTLPGNLNSTAVSGQWGDIAIDPATGRIYAWFHASSGANTSYTGLYELTNPGGTSPGLVKIGSTYQSLTVGTLFFTDRGQLFGYGSTSLGGNQDRLYAIDKATGSYLQYGAPDLAVSQSDGCNCSFRLSLEKSASTPIINLRRCSVDTFNYNYRINNTTAGTFTGIGLTDTLDYRLSFATSASALQTTLRGIYGTGVTVVFSDYNGGTNNLLTVTGMSVASTIGITSPFIPIPVRLSAQQFGVPTVLSQQAFLTGVPTDLAGPYEPSDNPVTYQPADNTDITVNISGSACLPPIANNFTNIPMPQGYLATIIPPPVGSDPDGSLSAFRIQTIPPASEGMLSYCPNAPASCNDAQYVTITSGVLPLNLTPQQASSLRFDPTLTFSGLASFTFTVTDNDGNESNSATYRLPVITVPPVANNIMENSMPNTNGVTAIRPLSSADADGLTNDSYLLLTYPTPAQGILSYCGQISGTCSAGQYINVTSNNITLSFAQAATLRFDPATGYTDNVSFTYKVKDLSGNWSDSAVYTIPVTSGNTMQRPPLADNIYAQPLNNNLAATFIPQLRAGDLDGYVTSYTIVSLPAASSGTLYLANPTPAPVVINQNIAIADIGKLQFDPLDTYIGDASFKYKATDNTALQSNIATYHLTIVNQVPTAINMTKVFAYGISSNTLPAINGTDKDGTIVGYKIKTLPSSGTLELCNPTCSSLSVHNSISLSDVDKLKYTAAANTYGIFSFTYTTTDHNGNESVPAQYNIVVSNVPPIAQDINNTTLANTAASTAIASLNATDIDGTIAYYTIRSLPVPASGILYLNTTALSVGNVLTTAQISQLKFDPANLYTGVASFTYTATDNSGNLSNLATVAIPVSGLGNLPPIANTIAVNALSIAAGPTNVPSLSGVDPEATVLTYRLENIPPSYRGILKYCPTAPTTCAAGSMVIATTGLTLTPVQAASLQFTPNSGYVGPYTFSYTSLDADGNRSNLANYYIPVYALPPTANPIVAPSVYNTASSAAIPALNGNDADGSVIQYVIQTLPPATQGALYLCDNVSCASPTIITTGQVIPASSASLLRFNPAETYLGDVIFNYMAVDNHTQNSNTAAYTIPVNGLAPVAQDVLSAKMNNGLGNTPIPALNGNPNGGGSIISYVINSIPPAAQGVLSLCTPGCTPVSIGQSIPTANIANLKFDPNASFIGDAIFNYTVYNAAGLSSNTAAFVIPIGTADALPVEGLTLEGNLQGSLAKLRWHTFNEQDMISYTLERSADGKYFEKRSVKSAIGLGNHSYNIDDETADLPLPASKIYYRVKAMDAKGQQAYSSTIALNITNKGVNIIIAPNPAKDVLNFTCPISGLLVISDISGRQIREYTVIGENKQQKIDISIIPTGIYYYKYVSEDHIQSGKLLISR